jgi:hypothetical protein
MAKSQVLMALSLVAAADLSAKQFFGIKVDSTGKAALAAAGEPCIGVLQNNPTSGQVATVGFLGTSKAKAGGSITAGDQVTTDANGKIVAATKGRTNTSDAGAAADALIGSNVIGIALSGASTDDVFEIALMYSGAVPTTVA